jgi:long-subunit fatty acid transport protein
MRKHFLVLGALAVAGAGLVQSAPIAAQTNGFVLQCLSAKAAGQGCITRGIEGLPTNMFRDPASIAWFDGAALEVNAAAFMPSLTFQNQANPDRASGALHSYPLGSVGYVARKPFDRFSWALGFEPIGGFGSDFKLTHPLLGPQVDYESFFAAARAGPVVAWEPIRGLSLGGSLNAVYSQIHKFRMPFAMPPHAAAGIGALAQMDPHYPALFGDFTELVAYGDSRDFSGWGWGASAGVAFRSPSFAISASWSPRTDLHLDGGTATIYMNRQFGIVFDALVRERIENHGESQQSAQQAIAGMLGAAGLDLAAGAAATFDAATEIRLILGQYLILSFFLHYTK